uniref:Skp1-related protein n=1 Tax=Ditylenchus dipsaci TaxID=166011 RepID=A0A915DYH4_9BILA
MSSGCEVNACSNVAVDVPAAGQVTVKTQGGELYQVGLAIISQCKTFSQMYEDLNLDAGDHFEFPIPAVTSKVFEKVLQWCENHIDVPEPVIKEDPATRERVWFQLTDDEKAFFNVPVDQLAELLAAANYLDIKSIYLFGCQTLAALIKGKSPEEIRDIFGLEDDMTAEEKDGIRKENVWCTY